MSKSKVAGAVGAIALAAMLIKPWEGLILVAQPDPVGIATGCYGYIKNVYVGQIFTVKQCDSLLISEIQIADNAIDRMVKVPLSDKTRAAFISLVYNIGAGNFQRSTLLKKLNAGDIIGACHEITKWTYARGKFFFGLKRRREAEMKMCLEGV